MYSLCGAVPFPVAFSSAVISHALVTGIPFFMGKQFHNLRDPTVTTVSLILSILDRPH